MGFTSQAEANVVSICTTGLDPKRRMGQAHGAGEYFATNATISVPYMKGGKKMVVMA